MQISGNRRARKSNLYCHAGRLREADRTGMTGSDAWLRALPAVVGKNPQTGKSHALETQGYVSRCTAYRAEYLKGNSK